MDSGPHLVLAHVVEPEVQRQPPRRRLEHQLRDARVPQLLLQPIGKVQIVHPVRHRHLEDVGRFLPLVLRQFKRQPSPHVRGLHVPRAEQQLPRMKRPTWRVANLPVGLHDGLAAGERGLHLVAYLVEHLGEQPLVVLGKGQRVAVAGEPLHEILGKVGSAHHSQLAEKRQPAVVQAEHRLRPHLARCPTGGVGLHRLGFQLLCLGQ